jgi:hypothetical protein
MPCGEEKDSLQQAFRGLQGNCDVTDIQNSPSTRSGIFTLRDSGIKVRYVYAGGIQSGEPCGEIETIRVTLRDNMNYAMHLNLEVCMREKKAFRQEIFGLGNSNNYLALLLATKHPPTAFPHLSLAQKISEAILILPKSSKFPDGLSIDPKWFKHYSNTLNRKSEALIAKAIEAFREGTPVTDISIFPPGDLGEIQIPEKGLKVRFYFEPTGATHLPQGALTFMKVTEMDGNEQAHMGDVTLGRDTYWKNYKNGGSPEFIQAMNLIAGKYGSFFVMPAELCAQKANLNFDQQRIFSSAIRGLTEKNAVIGSWHNSDETSGGTTLRESGNTVKYDYAWHRARTDDRQIIDRRIITNISVYGPGPDGKLLC